MRLAEFARPAVPVGYAELLLTVAAAHGVARDELLIAAGIPSALLEDSQARLTAWQAGGLLEAAQRLSGEPGFGYEVGLHSSLTSHGLMGFGVLSSASVRQAITLGERYLPLRLPMVSMTLSVDGDTAAIGVAETAPLGSIRQCLLDLFLVGIARLSPMLTGDPGRLADLELWFDGQEPDYYRRYADRLPPTRFDRGANQVRFPAADLDLRPDTADAATASMVEDHCRSELEVLGLVADPVAQVRAVLRTSLADSDLDSVAGRLHVSARTLKRRLHEHGTSFRELVDATRRAEATRLLTGTALPVAQVARRLGYADASSFTRAFQKWTGATPGAYRDDPARTTIP